MSRKSIIENQIFLEAKAAEEGIIEVGNGVLARVIEDGDGICPGPRSIVSVYYTGKLINGHVFDDNRQQGYPSALRLSDLIDGWQVALPKMKAGSRWELFIPAELGYGKRPMGDIPGGSTLIFDIQLVAVQ